ncbi:MAG: hypothetical protein IKE91_06020 [Clostridia bacterium]|nr:hypothetical protein [Clostridia bacterium]
MKVVVIGVCIIISIYLLVLIINIIRKPTSNFVVEEGKIYKEEYAEGYVIREENLIEIPNASNGIVAIRSEGEKVAKGESVYRYCVEDEEEINNKISDIDMQIQNTIDGIEDEEYYSADIKIINAQINSKLDSLYEIDDLQKIGQGKTEIGNYLTKKIKIRAEDSDNNELKSLLKQRDAFENELKEESSYIYADDSGVISYRVDGLESKLTSEDLSYLNESFLNDLNIETGKLIASTTDSGKIVNNFKCNIACLLDSEEAKNCEVGKTIKLRLQDSKEIPAKIIKKDEQASGKQLIVFEVTNSVVDLIKYRKVSFDVIWWSYSGLKIPNSAIKYEGDFAYVTRNRAGLKEKIVVKVLKSNDKYSIVENYTYSELKEAGYDMSSLSNKKTISVFDQIEN